MKVRSRVVVTLALCFLVLTSFSMVMAQEEEKAEKGTLNLFEVMFGNILSASLFIPLFGVSIATCALVIDYFINIRRDKLIPPDLVGEVEALFEEEEYGEAMDLCDAEPNYFTKVVGAAIPKIGSGYDAVKAALGDATGEQNGRLMIKISWLSLCASLGPMLGLLGTVTGMVQAFAEIAAKDEPPKPAELAIGIQTALITTVFGLFIAIPATGFFFLFKNRCAKIAMDAGAIFDLLIDRFRPEGS